RDLALLAVIVGLAVSWAGERWHSQSSIFYTGNPLDLAIAGDGFFTITDPQTSVWVVTRQGSLFINADGLLAVRAKGLEWPVNPAICIPADASAISVSLDGRVSVQQAGTSSLSQVGQLQVATFKEPGKLRRLGSSLYGQDNRTGSPIATL